MFVAPGAEPNTARPYDPYASERRWFLERTRPLRKKLELEHDGNASGIGAPPAAE